MIWIAVGAVAVYDFAHNDHSDYHSNHSQYSDASKVLEIKQMQERINAKERALSHLKNDFKIQKEEGIEELTADEVLGEIIAEHGHNISKAQLVKELENRLKEELEDDKEELKELNALITKINTIKLSGKG